MKKIEKLIHINTDEKQHVSPDTVFEMCCKINEIIDFLNQLKGQQVELTNKQVTDFVKHTDQNRELNQIAKGSEKQPEKCDCDYCKAYRFSMEKEPEKQEGWVEEWRKLSFEIGSITKQQADEIEDFISQLLSERTFSKEELYGLSIWSGDIGAFGVVSKEDAELINKIYKLLDEENE